jgi:hypothetical protein
VFPLSFFFAVDAFGSRGGGAGGRVEVEFND